MFLLLESIIWLPFLLAFAVLCFSTYLIENRSYGVTIFGTVVLLGILGYFYKDTLIASWDSGALISTVAKWVGIWIGMGVVTAVLMWFYIIRRAARYVDEIQVLNQSNVWASLASYTSYSHNDEPAFSEYGIKLVGLVHAARRYASRFGIDFSQSLYTARGSRPETMAELELALQEKVETYLPPKAGDNKWNLVGSAIAWPSTLLWLALYGLLTELAEALFKVSRKLLDMTSRMLFPSMNLKGLDEMKAAAVEVAPVPQGLDTRFSSSVIK